MKLVGIEHLVFFSLCFYLSGTFAKTFKNEGILKMYALVIITLETVEHRQETEVPIFVDKYKEFFNNLFHFC